LSEREFLLYTLLAERIGTPVSRDEILRRVWGGERDTRSASNVVDVYVRYLRLKLSRVAPHLVIEAVRYVGYQLSLRAVRTADPSD
jgi:two-component system response regulator ArlR